VSGGIGGWNAQNGTFGVGGAGGGGWYPNPNAILPGLGFSGGGGSSYVIPGASGVVHTQGDLAGNGQVTFVW